MLLSYTLHIPFSTEYQRQLTESTPVHHAGRQRQVKSVKGHRS